MDDSAERGGQLTPKLFTIMFYMLKAKIHGFVFSTFRKPHIYFESEMPSNSDATNV